MKQKNTSVIFKLLVLCLASLPLLTGCGSAAPEEMPPEVTVCEHEARAAELEATLQKEREAFYIKESELQQSIAALQAELNALKSPSKPTGGQAGNGTEMILHYRVENGGAVITGFEGDATLVTIPATLDGYPVTVIGERAFEGNTAIAAVVIPEGVQKIDWFAFYGCSALLDVTLPASVTLIGHAVFDGCPNATLVCPVGSYAESYAQSYGLSHLSK